jgi:hypothetical protein
MMAGEYLHLQGRGACVGAVGSANQLKATRCAGGSGSGSFSSM